MERFLVYQVSIGMDTGGKNNIITNEVTIRNIEATSKHEAIGKFIDNVHVYGYDRADIFCYRMKEVVTID